MPIDYKKYPTNWSDTRERILDRADHKCESCGLHNYQAVVSVVDDDGRRRWIAGPVMMRILMQIGKSPKEVVVVLTVAHLDHDEDNHDVKDERLAALCQLCHLRYDAPEKARRRALKKSGFEQAIDNHIEEIQKEENL